MGAVCLLASISLAFIKKKRSCTSAWKWNFHLMTLVFVTAVFCLCSLNVYVVLILILQCKTLNRKILPFFFPLKINNNYICKWNVSCHFLGQRKPYCAVITPALQSGLKKYFQLVALENARDKHLIWNKPDFLIQFWAHLVWGITESRSVSQKDFMSCEITPCCKIWLIGCDVKCRVMIVLWQQKFT